MKNQVQNCTLTEKDLSRDEKWNFGKDLQDSGLQHRFKCLISLYLLFISMEEAGSSPFLNFWHTSMLAGAVLMILVGIIIYLMHKVRVASIVDFKAKYDFINLKEIKTYKLTFLCFGIATMMIVNLYGMGKLTQIGVWFFVRLFISIAAGTLVSYVSFLVLDYYYPTVLNSKLRKWRYAPRKTKTGEVMRLLTEEEEDVHLEEGMRAEENVFSIDYDVWVDDKTGEIKIEKYPGHLQAFQCNTCGFYTMKVVKEEITKNPSKDSPGELIKNYQCSYCKSVRATAFNISTRDIDDYRMLQANPRKKNREVDLVRVEIHSIGGKKFFEFQNLEQAQKFLEEFDTEKTTA